MNDSNPLAGLPQVPTFTLTSTDISDGQPLPAAQLSGVFGVPGGGDVSPQLSWSGAPDGTKSYASPCTTRMPPPAPASGTGRLPTSRRQ